MTEFSSDSFVSVGPQSQWSTAWTPVVTSTDGASSAASSSTTAFLAAEATPSVIGSMPSGIWSNTWDVPSGAELTKASPTKSSNGSATAAAAATWSTTWDVPASNDKKSSMLSPNGKSVVNATTQKKLEQPSPSKAVTAPIIATTSAVSTPLATPPTTTSTISAAAVSAAPFMPSGELEPPVTQAKSALYKTELCRSWLEKGVCKYGHKCQFAHGEDELRVILRHPKYKTEPCKTFTTTGHCPYGNRCRFIHNGGSAANAGSGNWSAGASVHSSSSSSVTSSSPPSSSTNVFDVSQLLAFLPADEADQADQHRLNFFKHLTDE